MAKEWEDFEKLIADLHAVLPNADVEHNVRIRGRSGRIRQIDVAITTRAAGYPILIAVEVKRYLRPVGIREVEAFASKLRDVRAAQGILVAAAFDEGARAVSREHMVTLMSFEEVRETDWRTIFGDGAVLYFRRSRVRFTDIQAQLLTSDPNMAITLDMQITDTAGNVVGTLNSIMEQARSVAKSSDVPGAFGVRLTPQLPWYLELRKRRDQIVSLEFRGVRSLREYAVYPRLALGHILRNEETKNLEFAELWTEEMPTKHWFPPEGGYELSKEDYERLNRERTDLQNFGRVELDADAMFKMQILVYPDEGRQGLVQGDN